MCKFAIICNTDIIRIVDCDRRHATSVETPCANPRSYKSLSFTGSADMSTGILRQHDAATLGVSTQLYITHNRIIVIIVKHDHNSKTDVHLYDSEMMCIIVFNRMFNSSIIVHNVSSFPWYYTHYFEIDLLLLRLCGIKRKKNNSETECHHFNSEIKRFNSHNSQNNSHNSEITRVGHGALLGSRYNSKMMRIMNFIGVLF